MKMIKQPTIPPMPKRPTFDARDTQYNLPIGTDLISRTEAIEVVQKRHFTLSKEKVLLINDLEKLPSAQPDIIRCKDCKYWDTTWQNDYAPNYHYCPMIDSTRRNDFYCADAERRTDG